jgi:hypothetical protein
MYPIGVAVSIGYFGLVFMPYVGSTVLNIPTSQGVLGRRIVVARRSVGRHIDGMA